MDMKNRMARPTGGSQPVAPAPAAPRAAPAPTPAAPTVSKVEKPKKKRKWPIFVGIILIIALIVGGAFLIKKSNGSSMIDGNKFQAVFLTNGQVYFGKLSIVGSYYKLSDVYYLQNKTGESPDAGGQLSAKGDVELIKLGNEVHGPENSMIIERSQVLFFENLKNDGNVVKSIQQHQKSNR